MLQSCHLFYIPITAPFIPMHYTMTPRKIQKCSAAQKSVKDAPLDRESMNAFDMIPEHLHSHILGFLLAKPIPVEHPKNFNVKTRPYDMLREDHHHISLVSKAWRAIMADCVNAGSPREILTPRELAELKSKVFSLDLSDVHDAFEKLIKVYWPEHLRVEPFDVYETDPLQTVMNQLRPKVFIKMVEDEYKRFLVIKCVETLASRKKNIDDASMWLTSVQPCKLVEVFWQAHCLCTKKYGTDCAAIVGQVIDFTGPYDTNEESSSLSAKHKLLFQFEQWFLKHNLLCGVCCRASTDACMVSEELMMTRQRLFAPDLDMDKLQDKIWELEDPEPPYDCECDLVCCPFCCDDANGFTYSSDESDGDSSEST